VRPTTQRAEESTRLSGATDCTALASDEHLMVRAASDDRQAFDELVTRHRGRVVGMVRRHFDGAEDAEDLAQEAFLRLYRARRGYRPSARLTTLLYRIVANLCIEEGRRRRRRPVQAPLVEDSAEAGGEQPEQAALSRDSSRRVRAALDRLPEKQKLAVLLARYEGRSYREIAETLDCTEKAVEAMLYRARQTLWSELSDL
jgi:RNA polymerase sigma-70 factor, ECF subfamily